MKISKRKLTIAMAKANKGVRDLESISKATYYRMTEGGEIFTKTVYRLAKELNVDVSELVADE